MGSAARALAAAAVITAVPAAHGMSLGEVDVRSALGEPLDARVPLTLNPGETVDASCFALARDPEPGVPVLAEGLLTVERLGDRSELRIRSSSSVYEPAMRVRVRAACPGQPGETLRQYSVLLDPRANDPVIANVPSIAASLDARNGDTLGAIATQVFPRNRAARDRYLRSMREVNPALGSLGDADPIPEGAHVALPDLRTFASGSAARNRGASPAPNVAVADASRAESPPAVAREKSTRRKPRSERTKSARATTAPVPRRDIAVSTAPASPPGDYVLRLSGGAVDLARSREVDDRTRAQLRERLMILESDDQVAAVLALRNRLAQLEQRVNELQLKLAQMPASFPTRTAEAPARAPAPAPPPPAEPAKPQVIAATPDTSTSAATSSSTPQGSPVAKEAEPPPAEASKTDATSGDSAKVASSGAGTGPATEAPAPKVQSSSSKPIALPPRTPGAAFDLRASWESYGLWMAFIGVLALLMWLVWRITHRPEPEYEADAWDQPPPTTEPGDYEVAEEANDQDATQALVAPDAGALRRRYIEERFPEVANGSLSLSDPASVVKGARLLYQDGAMPRAVELLQFAIEEHPDEVRPWLALFEIYRLERLSGEFAELARRFYEQHGDTESWRKVRYFGREVDPGNFLYREDVDALQTIAPGGGRREAIDVFDPAQENWLDSPVNAENERLANELRHALMSRAGVADEDLAPNPLPALRDAETFTVA